MTWWQITLAVVLNVPGIVVFIICVVSPTIRSAIDKFDKDRFADTVGAISAGAVALSSVVLFLSLFVLLLYGSVFKKTSNLTLTIAISSGVLILSIVTLLIVNRRR